ncbi:MAG: EamA family transporter [Clostridia bacterium]|nr:EamA family transporter [Clostridia bacterium]
MKERMKFILAVTLYGTIGVFLRFVSIPSEAVALYRGIIGAIFIFIYRAARGKMPDPSAIRKNGLWLLISGVGLGLNWIFLFAAYVNTTVAIASLCNYMAPIFVIALTPLVLREKLDKRKIPCIIAALAGIILVSGVIDGGITGPAGVAFGLAGACCFTGIVFCNRKLKDISAFDRALVQLVISAATVLPYVLVKNGGLPLPDLKSGLIVLMLGVLQTGVAYSLYFSGMGSLPVQSVAILGYIEPVVSVLCSVIFLHEPLGWYGWIGSALVISAAVISEIIPPVGSEEVSSGN